MKRLLSSFCIFAYFNLIFFAFSGQNAYAQELAGRVAGTTSPGAQSTVSVQNPDALMSATDLFTGNNNKGPFILAWKPIARDSERVIVDTNIMQRSLDYDIDYSTSMIAFKAPVTSGKSIRIEYSYDPSIAVKSASALNLPLSLDLLKKENVGLQFIGLYKQAEPDKTNSDMAVVGLAGNTKAKNSEMNSMFLYNPDRPGQANADDVSFLDKSALKFGGTTKTDNFQLTSSFLRIGEKFDASKEYQLQQGTEAIDIAASFAASKALNLSSSYKSSENLNPDKKGEFLSTATHNIAFTPGDSTKLSATRVETDKSKPGAVDQSVISDIIKLEQKLGTKTNAVVSHESKSTETNGVEDNQSLDQININTKPNDKLGINANLAKADTTAGGEINTVGVNINAEASKILNVNAAVNRIDSEKTGADNSESVAFMLTPNQKTNIGMNVGHRNTDAAGETRNLGFNIGIIPLKTLNVTAAVNRIDTDATGADNSESLNLIANPNKKISIEMNMGHRDTDVSGNEFTHALKLITAPRNDVQLELGVSGKNADLPVDESALVAKLSTTAIRNAKVQVDWVDNESDVKGKEETGTLRLEASPNKAITISGALGQKETDSNLNYSREARVVVAPSTQTTIGGAFTEVENNGNVISRVKEVSAAAKPADYLQISGAYKTRENDGLDDLDTMNLSLTLDTGNLLKLTGTYIVNPEDKKGVVQRTNSQTIGVNSDLGRVRLKGAYTMNGDTITGFMGDKTEVGMDMQLASNALLTTSYSIDRKIDTDRLETSVYALGFSHNIGNRFNLYLGGRMTMYEKNQMYMKDLTDLQAEAKLGLKF